MWSSLNNSLASTIDSSIISLGSTSIYSSSSSDIGFLQNPMINAVTKIPANIHNIQVINGTGCSIYPITAPSAPSVTPTIPIPNAELADIFSFFVNLFLNNTDASHIPNGATEIAACVAVWGTKLAFAIPNLASVSV